MPDHKTTSARCSAGGIDMFHAMLALQDLHMQAQICITAGESKPSQCRVKQYKTITFHLLSLWLGSAHPNAQYLPQCGLKLLTTSGEGMSRRVDLVVVVCAHLKNNSHASAAEVQSLSSVIH